MFPFPRLSSNNPPIVVSHSTGMTRVRSKSDTSMETYLLSHPNNNYNTNNNSINKKQISDDSNYDYLYENQEFTVFGNFDEED